MAKRYRVTLTAEERGELERMIARGKADARKLALARVLLQADEAEGGPARVDGDVASALDVSVRTVERVRQRFVEQGIEAALLPKPSPRLYGRKLDGGQEAHLLALACGRPPEGNRAVRFWPRAVCEGGAGGRGTSRAPELLRVEPSPRKLPWCRSPACSPPWTGSPTRAAARAGATASPPCCCSASWRC